MRVRRIRKLNVNNPELYLKGMVKDAQFKAISFAMLFPPDKEGDEDLVGAGTCMQGYNPNGDYILKDHGGNFYINGKLLVLKNETK